MYLVYLYGKLTISHSGDNILTYNGCEYVLLPHADMNTRYILPQHPVHVCASLVADDTYMVYDMCQANDYLNMLSVYSIIDDYEAVDKFHTQHGLYTYNMDEVYGLCVLDRWSERFE